MATTPFGGSVQKTKRTQRIGSDMHELAVQFNALANQVSHMMPGVILSAPAAKTGTTAATAWRTEAFTFTFRGKTTSAAAQEKAFTATSHDTAASKEAWYYLSVQTDGTTFVITKAADQTIGTKVLPTIPDNEVLVAVAQVITGSGGAFDATTHDFSVSSNIVTLNIYDAAYVKQVGNGAGVAFSSTVG